MRRSADLTGSPLIRSRVGLAAKLAASTLLAAAAVLALGTSAAGGAPAEATPVSEDAASMAKSPVAEDVVSPGTSLSGREIYQCVLDNRFDAYVQSSKLLSGDRGGATQESRLDMTWRSFRDPEAKRQVLSKTIVKYTAPFDLRFSGYLIVNNEGHPNDQFVYLAASRRIRRVNLRREAVFGTDFTFEDLVPREIEDGAYNRLPDKTIDGISTYVVEVTPADHADSEYSKFVIHVLKEHCVPILTRYWDDRDVEVKEMVAPASSVREIEGISWPMELTMRNLQLDTFTTLSVEDLTPNPELPRKTFDLRRLEAH